MDSANIGAIVGGVVSGVLVLTVAPTAWYCLKRRRRREQLRLEPVPIVVQVPVSSPRTKPEGKAPYNPPHSECAGAHITSQSRYFPRTHGVGVGVAHYRATPAGQLSLPKR